MKMIAIIRKVLTQGLLQVSNHSRLFMCIVFIRPLNSYAGHIFLLSPFYSWENWNEDWVGLHSEPKSFRRCQALLHFDIWVFLCKSAFDQLAKWWEGNFLIHLGSGLPWRSREKKWTNKNVNMMNNHCKNVPEVNKQIWFEGSWACFVVSVYLGLYSGATSILPVTQVPLPQPQLCKNNISKAKYHARGHFIVLPTVPYTTGMQNIFLKIKQNTWLTTGQNV